MSFISRNAFCHLEQHVPVFHFFDKRWKADEVRFQGESFGNTSREAFPEALGETGNEWVVSTI